MLHQRSTPTCDFDSSKQLLDTILFSLY